jgi:hypothetical protein
LARRERIAVGVDRPGLVFVAASTLAACSLSTLPRVSARLEVLPTARSADWVCSVRPEESSTKT